MEMDELAKQDHTYRLSSEECKRYQGAWYLTLNKSGKNAHMRLRPFFSSCSLSSKPAIIVIQVRKLKNQYLHSNTGDGTLPQPIPGGTRLKVGEALDFSLKEVTFFFWLQLVSLQSISNHCNRRGCTQIHFTRHLFSCTVRMFTDVNRTTLATVSACTLHPILMPSMMSG